MSKLFDFGKGNKPFGDWCIQFGIALVAGGIVGVAANVWVGGYALIAGFVAFYLGVCYKYPKKKKRPK